MLKMKKAGLRVTPQKPAATIEQRTPYHPPAVLSRGFREFPGRLSAGTIREVLGLILLSLSWESTSNSDRAILLSYADALERLLIDIRRGELHGELEAMPA